MVSILSLFLFSCSNDSIDLSLIESQIDKSIELTKMNIESKSIILEKAYVILPNKSSNYLNLKENSQQIDSIYHSIIKSTQTSPSQIDKLTSGFKKQLNLFVSIIDNNKAKEDDYIVSRIRNYFTGINRKDSISFDDFIISFNKTNVGIQKRIQLKLLYSNLKKFEEIILNGMNEQFDGSGIIMNKANAIVSFSKEEYSYNDTVSLEINTIAKNTQLEYKYYFGIVNSKLIDNSNNIFFCPAGTIAKPPMIKTLDVVQTDNNFKFKASQIGQNIISGVIEIKCKKGTFYIKFEDKYVVKK